jgi:antibiotic biosynthesis monooxygenase (ABM) superfamily enzyme
MNEALRAHEHETGATVVINHRVREGSHSDYERSLDEIVPICKAAPGFLDWHVIRPIRGLTQTYTFIIRFATEAHLRGWMESPVRIQLIDKVQCLLVSGDDFYARSGLDFWFTPSAAKAALPVRWRQFLVTWSAIFPLVLGAPFVVAPALGLIGVAQNRLIATLAVTGLVVFLMVYVVMPRYTRLLHRWLFKPS